VAGRDGARHRHLFGVDDLGVRLQDGTVGFEQRESLVDHVALERGIARATQRSAQGEFAVQRSRRCHFLGNIAHRGQHDSGQTSGFKDVGERTHGTRAQRSNRSEENDVDCVCEQLLGACWASVEPQFRHGVGLVACEGKVARCDIADDVCGRHFFEPVDWVHHVDVELEATVVKVRAPMAHDHVSVATVERTEPNIGLRKAILVGSMQRRRGHDGNPRLRKRFAERSEGRLFKDRHFLLGSKCSHGGIASRWGGHRCVPIICRYNTRKVPHHPLPKNFTPRLRAPEDL